MASKCIRCGFCLESCPTFLETGHETESPRGRIYLIKSAELGAIQWEDTRESLDHCLGCRACESACPSGVEYGALLELARAKLKPNRAQRLATDLATRPNLLRLQLAMAQLFGIKRMPRWLQQRLSSAPAEVSLPAVQSSHSTHKISNPTQGEVAFLEGCAMRVLFPGVHDASKFLLESDGFEVSSTDLGCCGALHAHSGMAEEGQRRAESVRRLADGKTVITNSAGCGSWLKGSGVATLDISEAIFKIDLTRARWEGIITYHDACHLAHGQGVRQGPRELIKSVTGVNFIELHEADLCCGSAGTYNLTQPKMARRLLERKWANIEAAFATSPTDVPRAVILGNPGCHAWIAQASTERASSVRILHLAEFLAEALRGYPST